MLTRKAMELGGTALHSIQTVQISSFVVAPPMVSLNQAGCMSYNTYQIGYMSVALPYDFDNNNQTCPSWLSCLLFGSGVGGWGELVVLLKLAATRIKPETAWWEA